MNWHEDAIMLYKQGKKQTDIARQLNVDYEAVRSCVRRWRETGNIGGEQKKAFFGEGKKVTYNSNDNSYVYEVKIKIPKGKAITPELVMEMNDIDPSKWDVAFFTFNNWQGFVNNEDVEKVDLYQAKIQIKQKKQTGVSFSDIDEFFKKYEKIDFIKLTERQENNSSKILQIDVSDNHIGLLAWRNETNNDVDLHIQKERFLNCIEEIVLNCMGQKFKKIYFCTLGDIIHIDNDKNETTKGTYQQADGRFTKIFDFAVKTMEEAIEMLLTLNTSIEYVYTCGNHDRNTGYFLVKTLEAIYRNNKNVTFDITPKPMKAIHFGKVLIGLCHGDIPKKNKGAWMLKDYRKEFGDSDYIEEHSGHYHTEQAQMCNGIMCRSVMATCGSSYYEFQQGYRSDKGMQCFIWDENKGLQSIIYSHLD